MVDMPRPLPAIEVYQGDKFLARMKYNGVWLTSTAPTRDEAVEKCKGFYYTHTAQGKKDAL